MADLQNNVKSKMSFTDLIPSLNIASILSGQGIVNQVNAIKNFLAPETTDSTFTQLTDYFESVDFLLTMAKNPIISLYINPQSITVSKNILLNKTVTKGGFVVQFWGPDLETIAVKAETGYFGLSQVPLQAFDMFKDYCFQGRYNSRKPFKSLPIITMLYEGQALRGYFNSLTYTVVQQRPYIITYDFVFTVVEQISIPIVAAITNLTNTLVGQNYQNSDQIQNPLQLGKGWGVKLY